MPRCRGKWLLAAFALGGLSHGLAAPAATAADPNSSQADESQEPPATSGALERYFEEWNARVDAARDSQPSWSSPLVTTTAMLEERARFDVAFEHAGTGAATTDIDGGKGVDLIVAEATEIRIAAASYVIRSTPSGKGELSGFSDWPFLRIKERLFSSPETAGDYVVSAWMQAQAATGIAALSNRAFTLLPTLGFGKGFDAVAIQGTFGAVVPTTSEGTVGTQLAGNLAFQYHLARFFWPQMEINWTHYVDGQRDGKDQVYLTPGIVVGRLSWVERLKFTFGVGYQFAVAPRYQASPLLPAYDHAWLLTTRLSF